MLKLAPETEVRFKDKIVDEFQEEIYWMDIEQAHDFERLHKLQNDKARLEKIENFDKEIAELTRKQKDNTKAERDRLGIEIEKVKFLKSKLTMPEQRICEAITERAEKIQGAEKMLAFVQTFKTGEREKLPYVVLGGTRFAVVDNIIQKDVDGNRVFHLEKAATKKAK